LVFVAVPAVFMLVLPAVAMVAQLFYGPTAWITGAKPNFLLAGVAVVTLALEAWIIIEAIKAWPRAKGVLEE
jgi:carbon starvation protein